MERANLKRRILMELKNLISLSCKNPTGSQKFKQLHIALLKKYYNATEVHIDYHRHRVEMDIVIDDTHYNSKEVNTYLPTLYTNLLYDNLSRFLALCIEKDAKSIGFYAQLLKTFKAKEVTYTLV